MEFVKSIEKLSDQLRKSKLVFLLPVFSGLLLVLSSPPFNVPFLLFFSFLPLLIFLSYKCRSLKQSFLGGFIAGFIFFGQVLSWFFDVSTPSLVDIKSGVLSSFFVFLLWLVYTVISAFFVGLFSLGYRCLKNGSSWNVLLVPSLWVFFEYLRIWVSWIFTAGTESLSGPHWTLGNLGYSLAQNIGFRSLAGIGGMYFVSFLVIFINALFFFLVKSLLASKRKVKAWCSFAILLILVLTVV
ncbi:MAG: hypothetical protein Q8P74_01090, partial [bacterium]|nr:hypothetical protein [bacterium]